MINLISKSCIEIPEENKDLFWVSMILEQLTRQSRRFDNPDIIDQIPFFEIKNSKK